MMTNGDMTPEQFCYWLNGHFDLADNNKLSEEQIKVIREHLEMVFTKKVEGVMLTEGIELKPSITFPQTDAPKKWNPTKVFPSFFPTLDTRKIC